MKKKLLLFVACLLAITMTTQAAATVTVSRNGKKTTYKNARTYAMVGNKKVLLVGCQTFLKEGAYVGPVDELFVKSKLKVKSSTLSNQKTLTLTYGSRKLKITEGSPKAKINNSTTTLAAIPIHATYTASKKARWIVPIYSVCDRLGLEYKLKDGIVTIKSKAKPAAATTTTQKKQETTTAKPKPTKRKVILVLDAGHGGKDSGATGSNLAEKKLTLDIVLAAKKLFDKDNRFTVYYTRTKDVYPSLPDRYKLANSKNADLFVSVHINSASKSSTGTETLLSTNRVSVTKKNNITSRELASVMHTYAVKATGFTNRGLVNRPLLQVLRYTNMPACLIEYGFISNPTEAKKMNANTTKYGTALYNGICKLTLDKKLIDAK